MAALAPVVEQERDREQDDEDQASSEANGGAACSCIARPHQPAGRNTRISTSIRNGSSAPTSAGSR
jgi:hypothetical protein